jgi:hypothetical protein
MKAGKCSNPWLYALASALSTRSGTTEQSPQASQQRLHHFDAMAGFLPMLRQRSFHITCPYNEATDWVPTPASPFAGLHDACMTPHTHPRHRIQANK